MSAALNVDRMVADHGANEVTEAEAAVRMAAEKYAATLEDLKRAIGYAQLQRALDADRINPENRVVDIDSKRRAEGA